MAKKNFYTKKLSDSELLEIIEDEDFYLDEYFPSFNDPDTNMEDFDAVEEGPLADVFSSDNSDNQAEEILEDTNKVMNSEQKEVTEQIESEINLENINDNETEGDQEENDKNVESTIQRKWERRLATAPDLSEYNQSA
ncbi:uncharacterized protein LOC126736759 [Anthonomus grandis grandis]|uniref:uncharacterized protein LOC126736759 n=1 Tax=Anthonomus grandis grandis TaxID=2921223 RepID=UPI002165391F|nr:uncharacterized protein LOC126736759 [Anthonomus grandis grandis]